MMPITPIKHTKVLDLPMTPIEHTKKLDSFAGNIVLCETNTENRLGYQRYQYLNKKQLLLSILKDRVNFADEYELFPFFKKSDNSFASIMSFMSNSKSDQERLKEQLPKMRKIAPFEADDLVNKLRKNEFGLIISFELADEVEKKLLNLSANHFGELSFISGRNDKSSNVSMLLKEIIREVLLIKQRL